MDNKIYNQKGRTPKFELSTDSTQEGMTLSSTKTVFVPMDVLHYRAGYGESISSVTTGDGHHTVQCNVFDL